MMLPEAAASWRTGHGQTLILGMIFFLIFLAYFMVQGYSANLFGPQLGSDTLAVLYGFFTVFCFVSPSIVNTVGPRLTLFMGTLTYAILVLSSLAYMVGAAGSWVVILGGAINGVGSACTWTAQGRLMLQYADGERASGKVFQVFWSFFMGSAIIGGLVTFAYFSRSADDGNVPLFIFFFFIIIVASAGTVFLIPPEEVVRAGAGSGSSSSSNNSDNNGSGSSSSSKQYAAVPVPNNPTSSPLFDGDAEEEDYDDEEGHGAHGHHHHHDDDDERSNYNDSVLGGGGGGGGGGGAGGAGSKGAAGALADTNWWYEVRETVAMAKDRRMRRASLLYLYVGLNQPYQVVTFGNRFFTPSTLGLIFVVFYGAELLGAWAVARVVGDATRSARKRATRGYWQFLVTTTAGYGIALAMEASHDGGAAATIDSGRATFGNVFFGGLAMLLWGFSDSVVQALSYWQMKIWFPEGRESSRAVGFYKLVSSAGWCAGFALAPPSRLAPVWQLALSAVCYMAGLLLLEPPSDGEVE